MKLSGKVRKVGGEAPAVRIAKSDGVMNVVGMMAPKNQIIISSSNINKMIKQIELIDKADIYKKFIFIIVTDSNKDVENLNLKNCEIVFDVNLDFAKNYGVLIEDSKFKIANGLFIIDTEGVFKYIQIANLDNFELESFWSEVDRIKSEKKKGHHHENWMSV